MSKTKKKLRREAESGSEDAASGDSDSDSSGSNTSSSTSSSSSSSEGDKKARKKPSKVKNSKNRSSKDKKKKKRKHDSSDSESDDSSSSSTSSSSSDNQDGKKKKRFTPTDVEQKKTKRKDSDQFEIEGKCPDGRRSSPEAKSSRSVERTERGGDGGNFSKWDSPGREGRRGGGYQSNRNFDRRGGNHWNRGWNNDWRNNRDNGYRGRDGFGGGRDREWGRDRRDDGHAFRGGRNQEERWRNDDRGRNDERGRNDYRDRRPFEREDDRGRGAPDRNDSRPDRPDRDRELDKEREHEKRRSRSRSPRRPRNFPRRNNDDNDKDFEWGGRRDEPRVKKEEEQSPAEKEKPNFGLSGKLTEDTNTVNGVVVKYAEPVEARKPKRRWRLYPFKGEKALPTLHIHRQSCFLIGRDRKVCDLPVDHPSCSKQHAALQYRLVPFQREDGTTGRRVRPYIIDLESANGTFLNSKKIDPKRYVELMEKDVLKFGFSSREYVLLHENSKEDEDDDDVKPEDDVVQVKEEPE